MDGKLIEKLDRQRYWAVLLQTAGLLLVFTETLWVYIGMGATPSAFVVGGSFFGTMSGLFSPGLYMLIAGGMIVLAGVLTMKISWLIYNRK